MKTRTRILMPALAVAAVASMGVNALAQGEDRPNRFFGDGTMPDFIRQFAAADGEPGLSEEERAAMREALRETREDFLDRIDTDGDGEVSPEERRAALGEIRDRIRERRGARFNEADSDEDGCLSLEEFTGLPGISNVPEERVAMIYDHLDANDDDCISLDEFLRVLPPVGPGDRGGVPDDFPGPPGDE